MAHEEEDAEGAVTVTKRHKLLNVKEEALAPLPPSEMQTAIKELTEARNVYIQTKVSPTRKGRKPSTEGPVQRQVVQSLWAFS